MLPAFFCALCESADANQMIMQAAGVFPVEVLMKAAERVVRVAQELFLN